MAISTSITVPDAEHITVRIGLNNTVYVNAEGEAGQDTLAQVLQAAAGQVNSNIVVAEEGVDGSLRVNGDVFVLSNGQAPELVTDFNRQVKAGDTVVANTRQANGS